MTLLPNAVGVQASTWILPVYNTVRLPLCAYKPLGGVDAAAIAQPQCNLRHHLAAGAACLITRPAVQSASSTCGRDGLPHNPNRRAHCVIKLGSHLRVGAFALKRRRSALSLVPLRTRAFFPQSVAVTRSHSFGTVFRIGHPLRMHAPACIASLLLSASHTHTPLDDLRPHRRPPRWIVHRPHPRRPHRRAQRCESFDLRPGSLVARLGTPVKDTAPFLSLRVQLAHLQLSLSVACSRHPPFGTSVLASTTAPYILISSAHTRCREGPAALP